MRDMKAGVVGGALLETMATGPGSGCLDRGLPYRIRKPYTEKEQRKVKTQLTGGTILEVK